MLYPRRYGKPLGTSLGNIPSNSFKRVLTLLGRDSSSLLVALLFIIKKKKGVFPYKSFYFIINFQVFWGNNTTGGGTRLQTHSLLYFYFI